MLCSIKALKQLSQFVHVSQFAKDEGSIIFIWINFVKVTSMFLSLVFSIQINFVSFLKSLKKKNTVAM